jgi:lysozyme
MMQGIDIASYQGGIDLAAVPGDFAIVKITGGAWYTNPYAASQIAGARAAGKRLAAYHFARDGAASGTAAEEAAWFLRHAPAGVLPVLDWEDHSITRDVGWAAEWLRIVYEATGIRPIFYTYRSIVESFDFSGIARDHKLWLALYGADQQVNGYVDHREPPAAPYWGRASIWQYTQKGRLPGYAGNLDLNIAFEDVWQRGAAAAADDDLINGLGGLGR